MAEVKRRRREYWAGLGTVLVTIAVASFRVWPVPEAVAEEGVLESILDDRVVVGMVRMTVLVMALYAIASVPALIVGGRWVKGMGTSGILADDARAEWSGAVVEAQQEVDDLRKRLYDVQVFTEELWALVDIETAPE